MHRNSELLIIALILYLLVSNEVHLQEVVTTCWIISRHCAVSGLRLKLKEMHEVFKLFKTSNNNAF